MKMIRLDSQGYFQRDGARFWPVGCNYGPASTGPDFWIAWPEQEIRKDLAAMARLGFNTVRFFLVWEHFEPRPGRYDQTCEKRLPRLCRLCHEHGLLPHPSLFVGWMSGGIFWPPWKGRRNLFEDPCMARRSLAFVRRCARVLRDCPPLLAIDVGNEMSCLPDAHTAESDAVRDWCLELRKILREEVPSTLVVPGNEQMMFFKDQGFRLTDPIGWDFLSAHGYPVPLWNEAWMPGLKSTETQRRLPFYVKFLRAFGPVLVQEFGTIATFGAGEQRAYLKGVLERAWRAGANGFLFWCWKDFTAQRHPYDKGGIEKTLGLVDARGKVKPGLEVFVEFARELTSSRRGRPPSAVPRMVHLLLPREWYWRSNQRNPGNRPEVQFEQYAGADSILDELGWNAAVTREPHGRIPSIIPGAALRDDEIAGLVPKVRAGLRLLWWGLNFYAWGPACRELVGAEVVDFYPDHPASFSWNRKKWTLPGFPYETMAVVRPLRETEVLIADRQQRPLLLRKRIGRGEVWTLLPRCATSVHPNVAGERAFATELIRRFLAVGDVKRSRLR